MAADVVVPGVGPLPCPYMIIGEAPGRNEIEQGIPFVGRSGELLDETLTSALLRRSDTYITNIYKGDVGAGNRNPTPAEILSHRDTLKQELSECSPSGILLLGRVACDTFGYEGQRMADLVGRRKVGSYDDREFQCYPCYHPAYVLRSPTYLEDFRYAVFRFVLTTEVLAEHGV